MVIGGETESQSNRTCEKRTWTLEKNGAEIKMSAGPELINCRFWHGCAYDSKRQRIIVAGGSQLGNTVEILDIAPDGPMQNNEWRSGPTLPFNVFRHQLVYNPKLDSVFLIGGSFYEYNEYSGSVLKMEEESWTELDSMRLKTPRDKFVAMNVPRSFTEC